ncbi:hypothetical protein AB0J83_09775 [Actinoplanes sp. NPDC049596]|uniref:nSTAND1 domain-containing NTPase n=1 Tax=unclassified Actinoplanes TaxID=2626549 RepID=UPI00341E1754
MRSELTPVAVGRAAESAYQELDEAARLAARRLMLRLIDVGDDGRSDTRVVLDTNTALEVGADPGATGRALSALARARLVAADRDEVRIADETLIGAWERLAGWVGDDRAGHRQRQELLRAAMAWRRGGFDRALLLRGSRLEQAREWAGAHDDEVDGTTLAFVAASEQQERLLGQ